MASLDTTVQTRALAGKLWRVLAKSGYRWSAARPVEPSAAGSGCFRSARIRRKMMSAISAQTKGSPVVHIYERICERMRDLATAVSKPVRRRGRSGIGAAAAMLLPAAILTGCGIGTVDTTAHVSVALHGTVYGGQQPVSGSTIQLYSAGTSGNGSLAQALIPSGEYFLGGVRGCVTSGSVTCYTSVISDNNGGFNITGDYTCPTSTSQVYIVASGGNPGLTPAPTTLPWRWWLPWEVVTI
jgi:hypothetical protein